MSKASDEQIRIWAERITKSNREAFDSLFRSLHPRLVGFAFRYVENKAIANDIVQDSFIALWKKREELDPHRSVKAYLYQTVRNKSLNYIRNHSNETLGLELLNESEAHKSSDAEVDSDEESEKLVLLLKEWIKELPERQREAFELSRFEGLNHDEIAGVMEVSGNTVNNHIVAALNKLRARYDRYQKKTNE